MRGMDMTVTNDQLQSLKNQYAFDNMVETQHNYNHVLVYFNTKLSATHCENYR